MEYQNYSNVPWYRKSSISSWFVIIGLLIGPFIWVVAYSLITGDIFYNKVGADGNLKKWPKGNKVVAYIIVAIQLFYWINWIAKKFFI